MTVSSTTNKQSYSGNGSQSVFAYYFKIFADADIKVFVGTALKTINIDYTLSGVGATDGGNVTFTPGNAPAAGTGNVTLLRSLALTQGVDLVNYGRFDAEVIEAQYDKLTMMVQQLQEQADRTIRFSTTVSDAGGVEITDTVAERSGKVLAYDSNGDLSVANELGNWQGYWSASVTYKVRDLVFDSVTNNVYTCLINHVAGTLTADVISAKWALVVNAEAVALSAQTATTKASQAAASAASASSDLTLTNADVALTHADVVLSAADKVQTGLDRAQAASSANASSASAVSSANSAAAAAAAFDNFDDKYLGAKSSDPSTNNDGDALITGNLYFLTGTGMQVYDGAVWIAASSSGNVSMYVYEYIASSGQTDFSGDDINGNSLAYTTNNIHVTYAGLDIPKSDYTATNGTSLVLTSSAAAGAIVRIVAFQSFVVADTYTQSQADVLLAAKLPLAGGPLTGDVSHGDNVKAKFGSSDDLEIYHDGANSVIKDSGTGNLNIITNGPELALLTQGGLEYGVRIIQDGAVEMRHNDSTKLATTGSGVDVTGTVTTDGVYLGGTGAANKLDDYEEGTVTLTLTGSTGAPSSPQTTTAKYTKVGNTVTVVCTFNNKDVTGATGNVLVTGLPFTSSANEQLGHFSNSRGATNQYSGYMPASSTNMIQINYSGNALAWATIGGGVYAFINVTYITA